MTTSATDHVSSIRNDLEDISTLVSAFFNRYPEQLCLQDIFCQASHRDKILKEFKVYVDRLDSGSAVKTALVRTAEQLSTFSEAKKRSCYFDFELGRAQERMEKRQDDPLVTQAFKVFHTRAFQTKPYGLL